MSQPNQYAEFQDKIEELKREYRECAEIGDWVKCGDIGMELQEMDVPEIEIELSNELTEEQISDYRKWDKEVHGDIETQML